MAKQNAERKKPLFSVLEVSRETGQFRSTIYRWIKAGIIKSKQPAPGRTVFISRSEVRRVWDQDTLDALDRNGGAK